MRYLIGILVISGFFMNPGMVGDSPESSIGDFIIIQENSFVGQVSPSFQSPGQILVDGWETGDFGGQCVLFIQQFLNIFNDCDSFDCKSHPFRGTANEIVPNQSYPEVGDAVLLYGSLGHVAVIIGIYGNELELIESNYNLDEKVLIGRTIKIDDPGIKGYFHF